MYRHGDLLIVEVNGIPKDAEKQEDGILAKGEITGHHHRISDGSKAALMIAAGIAYIKALQNTEITHEEHDTITLPPGDYQVIRQQEYEPQGWKRVTD